MDDIRREFPSQISRNFVYYKKHSKTNSFSIHFPSEFSETLLKILHKNGIYSLYSHQKEAIEQIFAKKNVVISSGVASGKSLCYQIPITHSIIQNREVRALLLFPTKALTQDQFKSFTRFSAGYSINFGVYDGDTSSEERKQIRNKANVLFTNPDMLHLGILPHHPQWQQFFSNLRYLIVDEIHLYRGVFGSHFANLLRRIKRIAGFYGSNPQLILTSATLSNVTSFAEALIEEKVVLIQTDGAPKPEKHVLLYNPPFLNQELGIRRSSLQESVRLAEILLEKGLQTLIFTSSRRSVELIVRYLQRKNETWNIKGYRSGYLPNERRKLERGIHEGNIQGIVATNALELGIDIGGLDAVILHGYPGTIASLRQQIGRAGRRDKPAIAIMVASANLLDQYLLSHPEYLLQKEPEEALIDPNNPFILLHHLKCALFEKPFRKDEIFGTLSENTLDEYMQLLEKYKLVHKTEKMYYWKSASYPADSVSLRTIGVGNYALQAENAVIGMVDNASVYWLTHPGAIYLHNGVSYFVKAIEEDKKIVILQEKHTDYYTQAQMRSNFELIELKSIEEIIGGNKHFGKLKVIEQVTGYKKMKWYTNELISYENLEMQPQEMITYGYWFTIDEEIIQALLAENKWNNQPKNYGKNWKITAEKIRKRDNLSCQNCGAKEQERAFDVHHIKPLRTFQSPYDANQPENLITLCPSCHQSAEKQQYIQSGLAGFTYLLHEISPIFVMCDKHDIRFHYESHSCLAEQHHVIICRDAYPGGIGLSEKLCQLHYRILWEGFQILKNCDCETGCPACVGPVAENGIGAKEQVKGMIRHLITIGQ